MAQKKMRLAALLLSVLMVAAAFAGCGGTTAAPSASASESVVASAATADTSSASAGDSAGGDKIVIGSTFTLSGACAHAGQSTLEGAQLAIKYVNEELGGVNGKQVELKYYDDEYDESKIPQLYEKLINEDKVDLLLSPYTSPFLAAAPIVDKYDKIMFCDAADSYAANEQFGQDIVNIQMDGTWKGGMWWKDVCEFFADFDKWNTNGSTKPKTVAIVNLEITYGHEVSEAVGKFLKDNGFDVVYEEFFEPGVSDWTATVSKLKSLNPDIVFAPQYFEDSVTFVQKCKELNYYAPYMIIEGMGWDPTSWANPELGGLDPSVAKSGFFSYSVYKSKYKSDTKDYLANYVKEKYNSIPGNDILCGFMAAELACKAAIQAGSTEKADLIKALTSNTFNLAGYDYTMNETGGNGADFSWGVGQYIPSDLATADSSGDDWYVVYPEKYKDHDPVYPFKGWN